MRVLYVENCPLCGCAMVRDNSPSSPPVLQATDGCADAGCSCHQVDAGALLTAS